MKKAICALAALAAVLIPTAASAASHNSDTVRIYANRALRESNLQHTAVSWNGRYKCLQVENDCIPSEFQVPNNTGLTLKVHNHTVKPGECIIAVYTSYKSKQVHVTKACGKAGWLVDQQA